MGKGRGVWSCKEGEKMAKRMEGKCIGSFLAAALVQEGFCTISEGKECSVSLIRKFAAKM